MGRILQPRRDKKSGIYYFVRDVPKDIKELVGKTKFKRSLGTKDLSEAIPKFHEEYQQTEIQIKMARDYLANGYRLSPKDIQILAERFLASELNKYENERNFSKDELLRVVALASAVTQYRTPEAHEKRLDALGTYADELLRHNNLTISRESEDYYELLIAMAQRSIDLSIRVGERRAGDWSKQPDSIKDQKLSVKPITEPVKKDVLTITKLFEQYSEYQLRINDGNEITIKNRLADYSSAVKRFAELYPDIDVTTIGRQDTMAFKEVLLKLPSTSKHSITKLSLAKQVEIAKSQSMKLLSTATVRKQLNAISAVFQYAYDQLLIDLNPAHGLTKDLKKVQVKDVSVDKGYSKADLSKIFNSDLMIGKHLPQVADYGVAPIWLPILCYYTGARIEEMAQLGVNDLGFSDSSIYYLSINADGEDKTVKNVGSVRHIPLHQDLLELGFVEYVNSLPKGGRIFPKLKINNRGKYSRNISKWLENYFRGKLNTDPDVSPMHGFRHTFKTLARDAGIPKDISDELNGHSSGGVSQTYGKYSLELLQGELNKLPSIDNPDLLAGKVKVGELLLNEK